jgi:hypothetical protein
VRNFALTKGIVILLFLGCVRQAAAGYICQTGFMADQLLRHREL